MKYKRFVYTPIAIIIATLGFTVANEETHVNPRIFTDKFNQRLEKVISMWNRSSSEEENSIYQNEKSRMLPDEYQKEGYEKGLNMSIGEVFTKNFPEEVSKCINQHQFQITENYHQGKIIILNCFKATLILTLFKYLSTSPKSGIKLFDGLLEIKKIPEISCRGRSEGSQVSENCRGRNSRYFEHFGSTANLYNGYLKTYKKAMQKLISEKKTNWRKNLTEEEKAEQLNKINEGSQAFLSEILTNLGNEDAEKREEEKLKKEITDPKFLSVMNALTKNFMVKLRFYPGMSARMMRSHNGGVTFDLEIDDNSENAEDEDVSSYEESTREIRDSASEAKDFSSDSGEGGNRKKMKKRKKGAKKKAKELKKIIPYLLLPMLIQMTLLPFVFKKLFFLAMKALFAGKVALILVGFNLLRNTCIQNEDKYAQRIRVEHYGYKQGEEYGAWVNGRSINEPSLLTALSEEPFIGQKPIHSS